MRPLQSWRLPKGSASPISAAFCAHPARRGPRRACSERGGRRLGSRGSCSRDPSTAAIDRDIHAASQLPRSSAEVDQQWGQLCVRFVWTASAMCCIFSCMGRPTTNVYEVSAPDAEVLGLVRARRLQDRRCGGGSTSCAGCAAPCWVGGCSSPSSTGMPAPGGWLVRSVRLSGKQRTLLTRNYLPTGRLRCLSRAVSTSLAWAASV